MMKAVPGSSIAATAMSHGSALRRFAKGLRWRHVFSCTVGAGIRWGLLLALPLLLLAWIRPDVLRPALIVCIAILLPTMLLAAVRSWWHGRQTFSALRQSLSGSGTEIAALHDELQTWLEIDDLRASPAAAASSADRASMLRWLEKDVQQRLAPHRKRALAAVTLPRLGRWRWLLPVVFSLLLLWLVALWVAPPWSGAIGGFANQPEAGNDDGQGGSGFGPDANPEGTPPADGRKGEEPQSPSKDDPGDQSGDQPEPQPTVPTPEPEANVAPTDPGEVPPLIDLPDDQRFVVPEFIGDGPTRRARMHAAELEEQANAGSRSSSAAASAADPNQPNRSEPDFERAAEAALRSRYVPPAERAMVRRFFEKLRQKAKK
jgi:hypothetical protein